MKHTEACLVLSPDGKWRVENRPPPFRIDPRFDWSAELESATKNYRRNGEGQHGLYVTRKRREAKLRLRRKSKFMEAAE